MICVVRREALLCGQTRGSSVWSDTRPFCVVRQEALLCGQARGPSVWSAARPFCVVRCEALLCGEARDFSVWSGAGCNGFRPVLLTVLKKTTTENSAFYYTKLQAKIPTFNDKHAKLELLTPQQRRQNRMRFLYKISRDEVPTFPSEAFNYKHDIS